MLTRMFSSTALMLADFVPALMHPFVAVGGRLYLRWRPGGRRNPHWLAKALVQRTFARIPVRARMVHGLSITLPWCDYVDDLLSETGEYELETRVVLEEVLRPGMVVLDIGAHAGVFTLLAARKVGPAGQVHSFEADPATASWLRRNVERNAFANVTINSVALGDHEGSATFHVGSDAGVSSLAAARADLYRTRRITVPLTTLAVYCRDHALEAIDLIKIDVEGAELPVFQTARHLLAGADAPAMIIEFAPERQQAFGNSVQQLAQFLRECGYRLYRIGPLPLTALAEQVPDNEIYNVFAVPAQRAAALRSLFA